MYLKTKGLILRETAYNDADKLLTALTEDYGKMTLRGRGVRRSKSLMKPACQLLAYSEFTLFEYRNQTTIQEAQSLQLFPGLRADLELLSLGSYFAQVTEAVSQEDCPNPELLSLILNALYALSTLGKPQWVVKAAFELRLSCLAGYTPDLAGCAVCGASWPDRFDLSMGTLVCSGCRMPSEGIRMPVAPGVLDAMRYIAGCDGKRLFSFVLSAEALRQLNSITESYLATQLERSFSTLDFYKGLLLPMGAKDT